MRRRLHALPSTQQGGKSGIPQISRQGAPERESITTLMSSCDAWGIGTEAHVRVLAAHARLLLQTDASESPTLATVAAVQICVRVGPDSLASLAFWKLLLTDAQICVHLRLNLNVYAYGPSCCFRNVLKLQSGFVSALGSLNQKGEARLEGCDSRAFTKGLLHFWKWWMLYRKPMFGAMGGSLFAVVVAG